MVVTRLDGRSDRLLRYALSYRAAKVVAVHVVAGEAAARRIASRWMTECFADVPLYLLDRTTAGTAATIAEHVSTRLGDEWTYVTVLVAVGPGRRQLAADLEAAMRDIPTVCVAQAVL